MLTFDYNSDEQVLTLTFAGRLDTLAAGRLTEMMASEPAMQTLKPADKIVFDLNDVDYVASSFIRICVAQAKQLERGRFRIANCQPFIKKTFKISGLDELLNVT
jgi:anti-anti-sigma factor